MAENTEQKIQEVKASIGDLHIAPRKVRLVTDLIKGKPVGEAAIELRFLTKKAAGPVLKLLNSAMANAQHNFHLKPEELLIKNITVNQGRTLKRFMPRAQGRATPIRHHTSIVEIVLVGGYQPKGKKAQLAKHRKIKPVKEVSAAEVKPEAERPEISEEKAQVKWSDKGRRGGKIRQRFVDMKKRLFNRKTNA